MPWEVGNGSFCDLWMFDILVFDLGFEEFSEPWPNPLSDGIAGVRKGEVDLVEPSLDPLSEVLATKRGVSEAG